MTNFADQRNYKRCSGAFCKAAISLDNKKWHEVDLCDISAGGLKFFSESDFKHDNLVFFDLSVYNALTEFNMLLDGRITRKESDKSGIYYGAAFENLSKHNQVQLDEIVKSRMASGKPESMAMEDGVYSFVCTHRFRSRRSAYK